jgi:hypothetical protein
MTDEEVTLGIHTAMLQAMDDAFVLGAGFLKVTRTETGFAYERLQPWTVLIDESDG